MVRYSDIVSVFEPTLLIIEMMHHISNHLLKFITDFHLYRTHILSGLKKKLMH